jgi:hypothetical protein
MNFDELVDHFVDANNKGELIKHKHDVANISVPYSTPRSVCLYYKDQMDTFLQGKQYELTHYDNSSQPNTPDVWTLKPFDSVIVTGSGLAAYSTTPHTALDTLLIVSGSVQGLHVYAESTLKIADKERNGTYINKVVL